jgi:hypothetical protein
VLGFSLLWSPIMAELPYVTDDWSGLPHYTCLACGYDTLLAPRILDHCTICPATLALQPAPEAVVEAVTPEPPAPEPPPEPEPEPEPVPVPDDDEDEEPAP